eukprot:11205215-Lingulodinium_polyedra.AAC.1
MPRMIMPVSNCTRGSSSEWYSSLPAARWKAAASLAPSSSSPSGRFIAVAFVPGVAAGFALSKPASATSSRACRSSPLHS